MFLNVSMANVKDFFLLKTRQYPLIGSQFPVIQRDPSTLVTRIVDIFNMRVFSGTPIDTINLPEKVTTRFSNPSCLSSISAHFAMGLNPIK